MLDTWATEWLAHFWFSCVGDRGDNTGMWIVELDMSHNGETVISLSSTSIQSFKHHISFQCSAKNAFPRLFRSQTHLTHLLDSMSTNMLTMRSRLLSDSVLIVLEVLTYILDILSFQCWGETIAFTWRTCVLIMSYLFSLLIYSPAPLQPLGILTTCLAYRSLLLTNSLSEKEATWAAWQAYSWNKPIKCAKFFLDFPDASKPMSDVYIPHYPVDNTFPWMIGKHASPLSISIEEVNHS